MTALKHALEPLEGQSESAVTRTLNHIKHLIHEGDLDRVGEFLDAVKEKGSVG